jgi:hypothetical protein
MPNNYVANEPGFEVEDVVDPSTIPGIVKRDKQAAIEAGRARAERVAAAEGSPISTLARIAAQGMTAGLNDKVSSGIKSIFGDNSYETELANAREQDAIDHEAFPKLGMAAEMLGGAVPAALTAGAGAAAGLGQFARTALSAALTGGSYGYGKSDADSTLGLTKDTATGVGGGLALPLAAHGAGVTLRGLGRATMLKSLRLPKAENAELVRAANDGIDASSKLADRALDVPGMTLGSLAKNANAEKTAVGEAIGEALSGGKQMPAGQFIDTVVNTVKNNATSAGNELQGRTDALMVKRFLRRALQDRDELLSTDKMHQVREMLDDSANWKVSTPGAQAGAARAGRTAITPAMEYVAEDKDALRQAMSQYGPIAKISRLANDAKATNMVTSPVDTITGSAGKVLMDSMGVGVAKGSNAAGKALMSVAPAAAVPGASVGDAIMSRVAPDEAMSSAPMPEIDASEDDGIGIPADDMDDDGIGIPAD